MTIEPYEATMRDAIGDLSLRAWTPVFESPRDAMLPEVSEAFDREDWRAAQRGAVGAACDDPDFQRRGIARRLIDHAVEWFRGPGMSIAMVETGGDPGHAPARRTCESAGFRLLPVARYFRGI